MLADAQPPICRVHKHATKFQGARSLRRRGDGVMNDAHAYAATFMPCGDHEQGMVHAFVPLAIGVQRERRKGLALETGGCGIRQGVLNNGKHRERFSHGKRE